MGAVYKAKVTAPDQSLCDDSISIALPRLAIRKGGVTRKCAVHSMAPSIREVWLVIGAVLEAVAVGHNAAWSGTPLSIQGLLLCECPHPLHHKHRGALCKKRSKDGLDFVDEDRMDSG